MSKNISQNTEHEQVTSKERESLGWRLATVFMVLGIPLITMGAWVLMTNIQANKDIRLQEIQVLKK